jgi:ATPase subunit of ABC transporter with duplicated ATPase domains
LFSEVSFRVGPREHVGLVGANGVGKSTLLKLLADTSRPDDCEAAVGGIVGYMPQDVGVSSDARTMRELLLPLAPRAVRRRRWTVSREPWSRSRTTARSCARWTVS